MECRLLCPWNSPGKKTGVGLQFLTASELKTTMWLSGLSSLLFSASCYQRALLASVLTRALRLRAFPARALLGDCWRYLLYSLIFVNSSPATYWKKALSAKRSNSFSLLRPLFHKLSTNQQNILKFIFLCFFSNQESLLQLFIYYRLLNTYLIMKPACPGFVRRLCLQSIALMSRLARTVE
ncbi:hypothetical protein FD755_008614 [Muntiacus reevesi]|uniref:Uncharacterized protein n=1 Tax=Muntiacus reevesi TaxID=9886 RepID=A0A5J5ML14_MUNRE|nr:hypothetical protein FD755_008614 [Muntiacus reevesi]